MIRDGIKPDLTAYTSIQVIDDGDKKIISIIVLRGAKRPYHLTEKGLKPSGVFVRHGVSSVPATDESIRQMLRESDGIVFDKSRCLNQDLTFTYAEKYFSDNNVSFTDNNKRTLNLINTDGYYTNTALLESYQNSLQKPAIQPAPASFVVTLPKITSNAAENTAFSTEEKENMIIRQIKENSHITRKDVEMIFGIKKYTAIILLNNLLSAGKIVKIGTARTIRYIIPKE